MLDTVTPLKVQLYQGASERARPTFLIHSGYRPFPAVGREQGKGEGGARPTLRAVRIVVVVVVVVVVTTSRRTLSRDGRRVTPRGVVVLPDDRCAHRLDRRRHDVASNLLNLVLDPLPIFF